MTSKEAALRRQWEFGSEQNPFHSFNQHAFSLLFIHSIIHSYLFSRIFFYTFFSNTKIPTKSYFSASIFIFCFHFSIFLKIVLFLGHLYCYLISYFRFFDFKLIYFILFFSSLIHIKIAFRLYESNGEEMNLVFEFFQIFNFIFNEENYTQISLINYSKLNRK